jgi:hypothetical protein
MSNMTKRPATTPIPVQLSDKACLVLGEFRDPDTETGNRLVREIHRHTAFTEIG